MKVIRSAGGPLIGLDRNFFLDWSGINGKKFVGSNYLSASDYEAACAVTNRAGMSPRDIGKLSGLRSEGLVISMPMRTAVIHSDERSAFIAQVHNAEIGWSFSDVSLSFFNTARYDDNETVCFDSGSGTYLFFDAAYPAENVENDFISFTIGQGGMFTLETAMFCPNTLTLLTLVRISAVKI